MAFRKIRYIVINTQVTEGAGVHLKRVFGFHDTVDTDPFLLLDDFRSDNPEYYLKGFPWHPHRGIETITYMLDGKVEHGDSLGNSGVINAGGVQWMTAGSGIIHNEMPKGNENGLMGGFQLWANLPAKKKMTSPRYQEFAEKEIPVLNLDNGIIIKIICGSFENVKGPAQNVVISPEYLDITIPPDTTFNYKITDGYTLLVYVIEGNAYFDQNLKDHSSLVGDGNLVLYEKTGDELVITTQECKTRFLLISGKPLNEPVAWQGPIVMNTQEELKLAFEEYQNGTFIKRI